MLYYLSYFKDSFSPLRLFEYISVRTLGAAATAFILSLLIGPWLIRKLQAVNFGEQQTDTRVEGLQKAHKVGTPTMGGLLILLSAGVATISWANMSNRYILLTLSTFFLMGAIGFADDYLKIKRKNGLSVRVKFFAQLAWAGVVFSILWSMPDTQERVRDLMVPFFKNPVLDLGLVGGFIFLVIVLVGATNAVNLTDGLDGLAISCSNSSAMAYLLLTYVAGNYNYATYLQIPFVLGTGELTVFCGALLGSGLGFLWYNCHPAKIFMGDTGSLALGGAIAMFAILTKQELLLIIIGGVFVIEALSVVIQSGYFKYTKKRYGVGKRVFRCAPLHHHFEFLEKDRAKAENRSVELVETVIVTRFWILSIIFALIGIATLKIR